MKKPAILLCLCIAALSACSNDENNTGSTSGATNSNDGGNNNGGNVNNSPGVVMITYNANGIWERACRVYDSKYWEVSTLDISGSNGTKYIDLYPSDQCVTPEMEYAINFSITTPNLYTSTEQGKALHIDANYNSVQQTLLNRNLVALYNTNNLCGFNDWAINQAKEVLNSVCYSQSAEFNIFLIKDEIELFIGDTSTLNDGSSAELRPITLAPDTYQKL